jgi:hypothetical protein
MVFELAWWISSSVPRSGTAGRQGERLANNSTQPWQQGITGVFRPQHETDHPHDNGAKQNSPDAPQRLIDFEGGA